MRCLLIFSKPRGAVPFRKANTSEPCDGERQGTNPYELVAAAHAACFSMTLANELISAGCTPQRITTTVTVTMEPLSVGRTITGIQFDVLAEVPHKAERFYSRRGPRQNSLYDLPALER